MTFDEAFDKTKKAAIDAVNKVDEARKSEKAAKAREGIVRGFDRFMKAILPGEHQRKTEESAHRLIGASEPPQAIEK